MNIAIHTVRRQILFVLALFSIGTSFSGCDKPRSQDSAEVEKLRREVAEMKAQQMASPSATPSATSPPLPDTILSGSIFYRVRSGVTVVLSASRVYLLKPSVASPNPAELKEARLTLDDSLDYQIALHAPLWDFSRRNDLEVEEVEKLARRTPFQCTTDLSGKYQFRNIQPGEYYLFSTMNTTQAVGFWYRKLLIPANRTTSYDLDNSNIKAVAESGN